MKSSYEMKQAIDAQGFYFMARRILSRWEVFGHQQHDTRVSAESEGQRAVVDGQCESYEVVVVSLVPHPGCRACGSKEREDYDPRFVKHKDWCECLGRNH